MVSQVDESEQLIKCLILYQALGKTYGFYLNFNDGTDHRKQVSTFAGY